MQTLFEKYLLVFRFPFHQCHQHLSIRDIKGFLLHDLDLLGKMLWRGFFLVIRSLRVTRRVFSERLQRYTVLLLLVTLCLGWGGRWRGVLVFFTVRWLGVLFCGHTLPQHGKRFARQSWGRTQGRGAGDRNGRTGLVYISRFPGSMYCTANTERRYLLRWWWGWWGSRWRGSVSHPHPPVRAAVYILLMPLEVARLDRWVRALATMIGMPVVVPFSKVLVEVIPIPALPVAFAAYYYSSPSITMCVVAVVVVRHLQLDKQKGCRHLQLICACLGGLNI